jgi:hypothetical protein
MFEMYDDDYNFCLKRGSFMELKLVRNEINGKPKTVKLDQIEEMLEKDPHKLFYFDKDNSHKDLVGLVEHFEAKEYSVYLREVKFGLGDGDYMYEIHIL